MIKDSTKESLDLYVSHGYRPGGFLTAVLENNLMQAIGRADAENQADIVEIARYVYNDMPGLCHGSPAKVTAWLAQERDAMAEASEPSDEQLDAEYEAQKYDAVLDQR